MGVYVKNPANGAWHGPVANGNFHVKWNTAWHYPAGVYQKVGGVGGGYWHDTGYRGRPNPPQSLQVYDWNFGAVALTWAGPAAGGGPVVAYDLMMTDSGANPMAYAWGVGGPPWGNFGVAEDYVVAFFIRSVGIGGQVSDWVQGPGIGDGRMYSRARIGHTETGYYTTEYANRGWASAQASGARMNDEPFLCQPPNSNFFIQSMHWRNLRTQQGNVIAPQWNEWGPMTIYWYANGVAQNPITDNFGQIWSGDSKDWLLLSGGGYQATAWWGLAPHGSGWSNWRDPAHMLYADAVWVQGYETYGYSVYHITRNYLGNNYW